MGAQLWAFNDEVFSNYNAIPKAVVGSEQWDMFFNSERWRNMLSTIYALENRLVAQAKGDQAIIGTGLQPLRWLKTALESLQTYVGDGVTRLSKEQFMAHYESLIATAGAFGASGLDQILAMIVNPYVPGLREFWKEGPNVALQ